MKSLQLRLGLWLGISLVLVLSIATLVMSAFPRYLTEEYVMTRIEHDADALRQRLEVEKDARLRFTEGLIGPIYTLRNSGHYFQVLTEKDLIKSPSLGEFRLPIEMLPPGTVQMHYRQGPVQQKLLARVAGIHIEGVDITLLVAEDISHLASDISTMRLFYLIAMLITLLLLLGAQVWIIRHSLVPLEQARHQLRGVATGEVEKITTEVPREVKPLVDEVNRLTGDMRRTISRSRKALGNLAHALKGPLTVISQVLEDPDTKLNSDARETLCSQSEMIRQTIDYELRRARLSGAASPGEQFNIVPELEDLVAMMKKIYADKHLDFKLSIPSPRKYPLDRSDMLELLGNLVDNACKWASHQVHVKVETGDSFCFSIEDDGPGMPESEHGLLAQRGKRLDETRPGHGLGLSIVQDIVTDYSGELAFSRSALGGLKVRVWGI